MSNGIFNTNDIPLENRRIFEVIPSLDSIKQGIGDTLLRDMLGENQFGFTQSSDNKDVEIIYRLPYLWSQREYAPDDNIDDSFSKYKVGYVSFKPEYSNVAYTSVRIALPDDINKLWYNTQIVKRNATNNTLEVLTSSDIYARGIVTSDGTAKQNEYALNQQVLEFLRVLGYTLDDNNTGTTQALFMLDENNTSVDLTMLWKNSIMSWFGNSINFATIQYVDDSINTLSTTFMTSLSNLANDKMDKMNTTAQNLFTITTANPNKLVTLPSNIMLYDDINDLIHIERLKSTESEINTLNLKELIVSNNNLIFKTTLTDGSTSFNYYFKKNNNDLEIRSDSGLLIGLNSSYTYIPNKIKFFDNTTSSSVELDSRIKYTNDIQLAQTSNDLVALSDKALLTKSEIELAISSSVPPVNGVTSTGVTIMSADPTPNPTVEKGFMYYTDGTEGQPRGYYESSYLKLITSWQSQTTQIDKHAFQFNTNGTTTVVGYDLDNYYYDPANMPDRDVNNLPHGAFLTKYEITNIANDTANTLFDDIKLSDVNADNPIQNDNFVIVRNDVLTTLPENEFTYKVPNSSPMLSYINMFFSGIINVGGDRTVTNQVKSTALTTIGLKGVDVQTYVEADGAEYHSVINTVVSTTLTGWYLPDYVPRAADVVEFVDKEVSLIDTDHLHRLQDRTVVSDTTITYDWYPELQDGTFDSPITREATLGNPEEMTGMLISSPKNSDINPDYQREVRQFEGIQTLAEVKWADMKEAYDRMFTLDNNLVTSWYNSSSNYAVVNKFGLNINALEWVEKIDNSSTQYDKPTVVCMFQPLRYSISESYTENLLDVSNPTNAQLVRDDSHKFFGQYRNYDELDIIPKNAVYNMVNDAIDYAVTGIGQIYLGNKYVSRFNEVGVYSYRQQFNDIAQFGFEYLNVEADPGFPLAGAYPPATYPDGVPGDEQLYLWITAVDSTNTDFYWVLERLKNEDTIRISYTDDTGYYQGDFRIDIDASNNRIIDIHYDVSEDCDTDPVGDNCNDVNRTLTIFRIPVKTIGDPNYPRNTLNLIADGYLPTPPIDERDAPHFTCQIEAFIAAYEGVDQYTVKVNGADTMDSYLADKLVAGQGISLNLVDGAFGKAIEVSTTVAPDMQFIDLTDTPDDYVGHSNQVPVVNQAEDALEFVDFLPPFPSNYFTPNSNTWYKIFDSNVTEVGPAMIDIIIYSDSNRENPIGYAQVRAISIEGGTPVIGRQIDYYVKNQDKDGEIQIAVNGYNNGLRVYMKMNNSTLYSSMVEVEIAGRRDSSLFRNTNPYIAPVIDDPYNPSGQPASNIVEETVVFSGDWLSYWDGQSYHRGDDPQNDRDYITKQWADNRYAQINNVGTLQQVTDNGNTTDNQIIIQNGLNGYDMRKITINHNGTGDPYIQFLANGYSGFLNLRSSDGAMVVGPSGVLTSISYNSTPDDNDYVQKKWVIDNAAGNVDLQAVTDNGNYTTNQIIVKNATTSGLNTVISDDYFAIITPMGNASLEVNSLTLTETTYNNQVNIRASYANANAVKTILIDFARTNSSISDIDNIGNDALITKEYADAHYGGSGGAQDLQSVLTNGNEATIPIRISNQNPTGGEGSWIEQDYISFNNANWQLVKLSSNNAGTGGLVTLYSDNNTCTLEAVDGKLNISSGTQNGVQINYPYTTMNSTAIENASSGRVLISREYADAHYSSGSGAPDPGINNRLYSSDGNGNWKDTQFNLDPSNGLTYYGGDFKFHSINSFHFYTDASYFVHLDQNDDATDYFIIQRGSSNISILTFDTTQSRMILNESDQINNTPQSKELITKEYADSHYVTGGSAPTLDEVTTQGNLSTNNIIVGDTDATNPRTTIEPNRISLFGGTAGNETFFSISNDLTIEAGDNTTPSTTTIKANKIVAIKYDGTPFLANDNEDVVTKAYADNNYAGSAVWGGITGTLSNQTDLQNALNDKEDTITYDGAGKYMITNTTNDGYVWVDQIDGGTYN